MFRGIPPASAPAGGAAPVRRFGRFELQEELGRGGMGIVFRARDRKLGRVVALKVLQCEWGPGPAPNLKGEEAETLRRFLREARLAGRLDHAGIVRILEVGEESGRHFLSMEHVEGRSLEALLARPGELPLRRGIEVLRDAAVALHHAHTRGVVHRDLKPGNVLVGTDGRVRITDFGLARDLTSEASVRTAPGAVMGTLHYMSPEQISGDTSAIGTPTDLWSMGVLLYQVIAGRLPFDGNQAAELAKNIRSRSPAPPPPLDPQLSEMAARVCFKCLEKDPAHRYASSEALASDLTALLEGGAVQAPAVDKAPAKAPMKEARSARAPAAPPAISPLSVRFRTVLLRPGAVVPKGMRRSAAFLFAATLVSTVACVLLGGFLFREGGALLAVCLLAFSLQEEFVGVLEENRDDIWAGGSSPAKANLRLTLKIVAIFFGMFLGFGASVFLTSEDSIKAMLGPQLASYAGEHTRIQGIEYGSPGAIFRNNALSLVGCFLFAFLFRTGGALLFLGWNASVWGAVYGCLVRAQDSGRAVYAVKVFLATLPHIALESGGYVLAALGGIFLSKALAKYGLDDPVFRRVAVASSKLVGIGLLVVAIAAYIEARGTPNLARWLFQ